MRKFITITDVVVDIRQIHGSRVTKPASRTILRRLALIGCFGLSGCDVAGVRQQDYLVQEIERARSQSASVQADAERARQESVSAREFASRWRDEVRQLEQELEDLEKTYRNDAQSRGSEIAELRRDIDRKLNADDADDLAARLLDIREWRDRLRAMNVRAERVEKRLGEIEESFGFVEETVAPPWIKVKPGQSLERPPKTRDNSVP